MIPIPAIALHAPTGAPWDFFILFIVVIVGPPLMQRARIPGLIGLLVGGFVVGPHGLDLIEQGNSTVPELGQFGLLYLMFVAGVELDLTMLRSHKRDALLYAAMTFTFPMVFGTAVGLGLGWTTPAAILLGSLLASHTLLLYTGVRNAGLGADPAVPAAVGATVVTDTLTLIILAAVAGLQTEGGSAADVAAQVALGLAVLGVFSFVVLPWGVRIAFRYLGTDRLVRYVLALAAFVAAATVAEVFGIEGIVGAFFAGMALNRLVPNEGPLMNRIEFFGSAVFIPVFIISVGLLLDPAVMFQPETLKLAGLFILACLGGKALAAWLARPVLGYSGTQAQITYALSAPQAAATLAATIVGFNIGLFDDAVVNAVLVVILASIVSGTVVLARAERGAGTIAQAVPRLGGRILVALEDSAQAATAFAIAARVAVPDGGVVTSRYARQLGEHADADAELNAIGMAGLIVGIDTSPAVLVHDSLVDAVVHEAAGYAATLVLVAQADPDGSVVLGSWADAVAALAPAPVAILVGRLDEIQTVRLVAPEEQGANDALAQQLADRIGRGAALAVPHAGWADTLAPGDLAVVPVQPWDTLADPPRPPAGAALLLVPRSPVADAAEGPAAARVLA